ncbi:MAG: alpha-amylase family glycosyl hydrolase [Deltaproteobacteria bacterium]|nr:alpha-amylase family glycosyl hydrolase [Deltaproteobacteria bacterium]
MRGGHPVFYQILIDRFYDGDKTNNYMVDKSNPYGYHGGDLKGIYEKIGYLKELGVNSVIISPILDNVKSYVDYQGYKHYGYHGYWPENFDRIEEHFGDFKIMSKVSEELHRVGISYIQDIVINHAGYKSIWERNTLWVRSIRFGGCIDNDELKQCLFGLPDFKTERSDVRSFLIKVYKELMKRVRFDGLRIDAMRHVDNVVVRDIKEELRKINPDIVLIGEYWGSSADIRWTSIFSDYSVDFLFDFEFRDYLSGFLRKAMRAEVFVSYLNKRYSVAEKNYIVFLNNHDLDGIMTHFEINDKDVETNLLRIMAILQFVCGGIPLIYYGEENGLRVGKGIDNRRDMEFTEKIKGIREFYRKLIHYKKMGILSGNFKAEYIEGILTIVLKNSFGEIMLLVNCEDVERSKEVLGKSIIIRSLDFELLKVNPNGVERLIVH